MEKQKSAVDGRKARRKQQGEALQQKESELGRLAAEQNKEEFFKQIIALLQPLKSYIKRRLRVAYLTMQIRTPVYTSGDILDQVVLQAFENLGQKPKDLSLEQWLYQITNEILERYLRKRQSTDARRRSLEGLTKAELRTLEEIPFTADADKEVWLPEDLDDSEYQPPAFTPPADQSNPEEQLEREEELEQVLQALSRVPERERIVFELFAIEEFPKEAVARIVGVPPEQVPRLAETARAQVLDEIRKQQTERQNDRQRAS